MQARSSRPVLSWLDRDPAFRQLARQLDDLVVLVGFGGGLSWASVALRWGGGIEENT